MQVQELGDDGAMAIVKAWPMPAPGGAATLLWWLMPPALQQLDVTSPWSVVHQFQALFVVVLWMLAACAKMTLALVPSLVPLPVLTNFLQRISTAWDEYNSVSRIMRKTNGADGAIVLSCGAGGQSTIERALTQVWFVDVCLNLFLLRVGC